MLISARFKNFLNFCGFRKAIATAFWNFENSSKKFWDPLFSLLFIRKFLFFGNTNVCCEKLDLG